MFLQRNYCCCLAESIYLPITGNPGSNEVTLDNVASFLEHVLQRELHDARIVGDPQYTKVGISDFGAHTVRAGAKHLGTRGCVVRRDQRPEAVGNVVDLPPEFDALIFLQPERPHQSHAEIKVTGRGHGSRPRIPKRSQRRSRKHAVGGYRILRQTILTKPACERTARVIADPVSRKILGRLARQVRSVSREVIAPGSCDGQIFTGRVPVDGGQSPPGSDSPQHGPLEVRCLKHRCEVEKLTAIAQTIATASIAVTYVRIGYSWIRARISPFIALKGSKTMGPRVVRPERNAFSGALPYLQ